MFRSYTMKQYCLKEQLIKCSKMKLANRGCNVERHKIFL